MIIARFKNPINMGPEARDVRLFVLIVTPSKEKATKASLETGRTFATILADHSFKQSLLDAPNETEFRALMVVRAQELSGKSTLKNRLKYTYDPALRSAVSCALVDKPSEHKSLARSATCPARDLNKNRSNDPLDHIRCNIDNLYRKNSHTNRLFEVLKGCPQPSDPQTKTSNPLGDKLGQFCDPNANNKNLDPNKFQSNFSGFEFGRSLCRDFQRRLRYYPSDFIDAFIGPPRTLQKTIATVWFLYFGILLPTIAFSSLNLHQTHGHMGDLRKAIVGQVVGGLGFALLGGQPLVIIMTTAPLCLYTKGEMIVIHRCIRTWHLAY